MASNKTLIYLNISGNEFGIDFGEIFEPVLENSLLAEINVSNNSIGDISMSFISNGI